MNKIDTLLCRWLRFFRVYYNVIFDLAIIALSVVFLFITQTILISSLSVSVYDSSRFMPYVVFVLIIFFAIFDLVKAIRELPENRDSEKLADEAILAGCEQMKRAVAALGLLALTIALMNRLGFIISAILYMFCNMMFMTKKENRKPLQYIIISVLVAVAVYFAFKKFIYVYLPAGILKGVL